MRKKGQRKWKKTDEIGVKLVHKTLAGCPIHLLGATDWALNFLAANLKTVQFCDSQCPYTEPTAVLRSAFPGMKNRDFSWECSGRGIAEWGDEGPALGHYYIYHSAFHRVSEMAGIMQDRTAHKESIHLLKWQLMVKCCLDKVWSGGVGIIS